jgi:hypothetical protein
MDVRKIMDVYGENHMAMPFADTVAQKYKAVYIPFSTDGLYEVGVNKPLYFRPDPELDYTNCVIKGIELINTTEGAAMFGWGQIKDPISTTTIRNSMLYISNLDREVIATIPLHNLVKVFNDGKLTETHFTNHIWQNCYIEITDIAGVSAANGVWFVVYYDEIKK